jgi:hypothetical protein
LTSTPPALRWSFPNMFNLQQLPGDQMRIWAFAAGENV